MPHFSTLFSPKKINVMDIGIKAEGIHWGNLRLDKNHSHLLELPKLGISLQEPLTKYFVSKDIDYLTRC